MSVPPLCTLDQVKTYLGIIDALSDPLINSLIPAVSQKLLNAINRLDLLPTADYTDYLIGTGQQKLYLKHYPIIEVDSVQLSGEDLTRWNASIPTDSGWRFLQDPNPENQQYIELIGLCYGMEWPMVWPCSCTSNVPNIIVTYRAGYATVPAAIQQAAIEWISFQKSLSQLQSANPAVASIQIGDYSENAGPGRLAVDYMGIEIPQSVLNVIEQYQRMVV